MRVLELHASMRTIKRSSGRSAVGASAYITRSAMEDERTGETYDFRAKGGLEVSGLVLQDEAPEWAEDRRRLWNSLERSSKRKDAQVAREIEISLPHEFTADMRREAALKIAGVLLRYGGAVEYALHKPGADGDSRNFHGHFLFASKKFTGNGEWAAKGRMVEPQDLPEGYDPAKGKRFIPYCALDDVKRGPVELEALRGEIAAIQNDIAARQKLDVFVEHLSFAKRGLDKQPTQHVGPDATASERSGKPTDIGDKNRDTLARNQERAQARQEIKVIQIDIARERLKEKRSPAPAPKTQEEAYAEFYQDVYRRRTQMVEEIEREYGQQEKELREQAAKLTGSVDSAKWWHWRMLSGRTRKEKEELGRINTKLVDIGLYRTRKHAEFERDRRMRLEALKTAQEQALNPEPTSLPQAVNAPASGPEFTKEAAQLAATQAAQAAPAQGLYDAKKQARREHFRRMGAKAKAERENEARQGIEGQSMPEQPETAYGKKKRDYLRRAGATEKVQREESQTTSSPAPAEVGGVERRPQEGAVTPAFDEAATAAPPSNYEASKARYRRRVRAENDHAAEQFGGPTAEND